MMSFSREELAKKRLDKFSEVRTPSARVAFLRMVDGLACLDAESTTEDDQFRNYAFMHFALDARKQPSLYPLLQRAFSYGLELPESHRKRLSPRLDLSGARSYGEAAKGAYTALMTAAQPDLIAIVGDLLPPDAKDWPVKLD